MLSPAQLIEMYREEKEMVSDSIDTDFPSFKEWKTAYLKEYNPCHDDSSFLSIDVALEITEAEIEPLPAVHAI